MLPDYGWGLSADVKTYRIDAVDPPQLVLASVFRSQFGLSDYAEAEAPVQDSRVRRGFGGNHMCRRLAIAAMGLLLIISGWAVVTAQDVPYRISDKELEQNLHRLKKDTDKFRKSLDSSLDRSRLDGTRREDDINSFMKDFESETARLYDRFKDHKSVSSDVESVLDRASRIDRFMARQQLSGKAARDWAAVRADLDELAQAYNVGWYWNRFDRP
jgi:hypothetical protein